MSSLFGGDKLERLPAGQWYWVPANSLECACGTMTYWSNGEAKRECGCKGSAEGNK